LHDLHGNVWEWCDDHWHDNEQRLLRGGSWDDYPDECRSAYRYRFRPDDASIRIGFRVVCLPQGPSLNH
jgi:formylglycine-generating enzyme required for sulfatase activity